MTQRDQYVALLLSHDGERYSARDECRCHGTCPGWDCSGFVSGDLLKEAGGPYICGNTDTLAAELKAKGLTCNRTTARATKGAWAIRPKENPQFPHDGHIVCSLGDGRTIEAHDTADGVYIGTFDGNRGFSVFGYPPGITGFNQPPGLNPGPATPAEARVMHMSAAALTIGSKPQPQGAWKNKMPFVAAIVQPNGTTDVCGMIGAEIVTPPNAVAFQGMSVVRLGQLQSPIEAFDASDDGFLVGLAADGGVFRFKTVNHYL